MNEETSVVRSRFHRPLEKGRVECTLCPRNCRPSPGQRAFCFIRENRDGEMVLTSYGRASGFCVDPIEKKPLNHFYPGSSVLSFGTAGCNLGCRFCQNWHISKARESDRLTSFASPEAIAAGAVRASCKSVAFTYNDPVIFAEFAIDTAKACHEMGVKTVAVTAGYITREARGPFFGVMDAVNIDLKSFRETFYRKLCFGHLQPILDTIRFLKNETGTWFEITTLLIPGENDSEDELRQLVDWVASEVGSEVPLHFSAFHPDFKMGDRPRTPATTLSRARTIAIEAGLAHVYTGNVSDPKGQSTYCASCKELVVERDWYRIGRYAIDTSGHCRHCKAPVAGRFGERAAQSSPVPRRTRLR